MKIKIIFLIMISRLVRGIGMGLGTSAIAFIIWFFFFSVDEYKYFWAFLAILQFFVGYLMYRFAYSYIYDE